MGLCHLRSTVTRILHSCLVPVLKLSRKRNVHLRANCSACVTLRLLAMLIGSPTLVCYIRLELRRIHTDLLFMFKLSHSLITRELQLALQNAMHREIKSWLLLQTFYSFCSKACLKHILSLSCFTCMEFFT